MGDVLSTSCSASNKLCCRKQMSRMERVDRTKQHYEIMRIVAKQEVTKTDDQTVKTADKETNTEQGQLDLMRAELKSAIYFNKQANRNLQTIDAQIASLAGTAMLSLTGPRMGAVRKINEPSPAPERPSTIYEEPWVSVEKIYEGIFKKIYEEADCE